MKRNLKGFIAIGLFALLAIGLATATLTIVTEDANKIGEFANTTITANDIASTKSDDSSNVFVSTTDESKAHATPTYVEAMPEVGYLPAKTLNIDSGSNAGSYYKIDNTYLYGDYLKEVEKFCADYFDYYNPDVSFNNNLHENALFLQASPSRQVAITRAYDLEDGDREGLLMTASVANNEYRALQAIPAQKNVGSYVLADSNTLINDIAIREFIKWHLGEENNKNIKTAFKQMSNINETSNKETWWEFCEAFTNYRYLELYSNAVDQFVGYFLDDYTLPGINDQVLFAKKMAFNEFEYVDFAQVDCIDEYKGEEIINDLEVDYVMKDFRDQVVTEAAVMSDADFNKMAKKEILAILDGQYDKKVFKDSQLSQDTNYQKVRNEFYNNYLKYHDGNVYRAYMDLIQANDDYNAYISTADEFYEVLSEKEYDEHVDTFLARFADEYGIKDFDDVNEIIEQSNKQMLQKFTVSKVKLAKAQEEDGETIETQLFDTKQVDNEEDEVAKPVMLAQRFRREVVDDVKTGISIKDAFINWHLDQFDNRNDALSNIVYINNYADDCDWFNFADDFYSKLIGRIPEAAVAEAVAVEAATAAVDMADEDGLSLEEITDWANAVEAILSDSGVPTSMTKDIVTLSTNSTNPSDIRNMLEEVAAGEYDNAATHVLEKVTELEPFYEGIELIVANLNGDENIKEDNYSPDVVRSILANFIETDDLPSLMKMTTEIINNNLAYNQFVAFINNNISEDVEIDELAAEECVEEEDEEDVAPAAAPMVINVEELKEIKEINPAEFKEKLENEEAIDEEKKIEEVIEEAPEEMLLSLKLEEKPAAEETKEEAFAEK